MFQIDALSRTPVYLQLIEQTERLILSGVLPSGAQIPSVRSLSIELSVNPNTIQRAYLELEKRGTTYSIQGKGSFINEDFERLTSAKKEILLTEVDSLVEQAITLEMKEEELHDAISVSYQRHQSGRYR